MIHGSWGFNHQAETFAPQGASPSGTAAWNLWVFKKLKAEIGGPEVINGLV
jgi:hypothetical protein